MSTSQAIASLGKLIYLASPYTHKDTSITEKRFQEAVVCCGWLLTNRRGCYFYSPIAHTHPIAQKCKLPIEWAFWEAFDRCTISRCDEVWVLCIPGFSISTGVKAECKIAVEEFNLPVRYIVPQPDGDYIITDQEPPDDLNKI